MKNCLTSDKAQQAYRGIMVDVQGLHSSGNSMLWSKGHFTCHFKD